MSADSSAVRGASAAETAAAFSVAGPLDVSIDGWYAGRASWREYPVLPGFGDQRALRPNFFIRTGRGTPRRSGSARVGQNRIEGLPGSADLVAHHDLRDAVGQAEQAEQQGQGDRADVRAGHEHHAE